MHHGALASQGDYLLFLHADAYFKENPLQEIIQICQQGYLGAFSISFEPNHWLLRIIAWGSSWRVKHRNIAFGDQGMFMSKHHYFQIGGFPQIALMEDYEFSQKARNLGLKFKLSPIRIVASSRYFQKVGIIKALVIMQYCQCKFRKGASIQEIQKIYKSY